MGIFRKTIRTVNFTYKGHDIRVVNWWRVAPLQSVMSLYLDGELVAADDRTVQLNPLEPVISVSEISDEFEHIEVFFAGMTSSKFAVKINGEPIYSDPLNWLDRQHIRYLENEAAV